MRASLARRSPAPLATTVSDGLPMIRYLDELRDLGLSRGSYAVFGSGPLAIRGIRENRDLDVLVTPAEWEELSRKHVVTKKDGRPDTIHVGHVQLLEVGYRDWRPFLEDNDALIREAELIDGVPFVRLEHLLGCKRLMTGEKHARDVASILEHLGNG